MNGIKSISFNSKFPVSQVLKGTEVFTCKAAVDSSLGKESIKTSMSFAVRAMSAAKSWAYSRGRDYCFRALGLKFSETVRKH